MARLPRVPVYQDLLDDFAKRLAAEKTEGKMHYVTYYTEPERTVRWRQAVPPVERWAGSIELTALSESGPDDSVALGAASKQGFVLSASLRGQGRDLCPECYGKVWRAGAAGL